MKHFDASSFLCDIAHKDWESISALTDPNEMWTVWKGMLLESFDRHAPIKKKRIGKKRPSWMSSDLLNKMHKRDSLKRKASLLNDQNTWNDYKEARNQCNNAIRKAKSKYFKKNLDINKKDPKKTGK